MHKASPQNTHLACNSQTLIPQELLSFAAAAAAAVVVVVAAAVVAVVVAAAAVVLLLLALLLAADVGHHNPSQACCAAAGRSIAWVVSVHEHPAWFQRLPGASFHLDAGLTQLKHNVLKCKKKANTSFFLFHAPPTPFTQRMHTVNRDTKAITATSA